MEAPDGLVEASGTRVALGTGTHDHTCSRLLSKSLPQHRLTIPLRILPQPWHCVNHSLHRIDLWYLPGQLCASSVIWLMHPEI